MSMISAQCDRLRERAATLRQGRWSDGEDDATLMERAADTILELRCKLAGVVDQNEEIERLKAENDKLREELAKARDPQRIGGQADQSSFVYAIEQLREFRWQHATNDEDAIPYINNVAAAHERENAKLREERDMYRDLVGNMVHPDIPDQLYAENTKLRELVEDMLDCIEIREAFGRPPTSEICEEFSRRADELRIEADE